MKIKSRTAVDLQINPIFLIRLDVRFGSQADMCGATRHVRFTPKSRHQNANKVGKELPPIILFIGGVSGEQRWRDPKPRTSRC